MRDRPLSRILMTGDTVGGVWTYALELARALDRHGTEVILAVMGGRPTGEQRAEAGLVANVTVLGSDFKLEWMTDPWDDVQQSGRWLLELERYYRPSLVHLNTYGHGTLPWKSPTVLVAHSCVLSWWKAVRREPIPPEWTRYRRLVAASIGAAGVVIAPTQSMLDALAEHYGPTDALDGRVIPNARGAATFSPAAKEPLILTAGRLWDEAKNVGALARIARHLPWPVYFAGDHCSPDGSAADFPGCRLLGRLGAAELAGWYARASIYALPARYEPFGLSALEAALSGCALVLGDIPSLREVWQEAAIFVAPDDYAGLQAAVTRLIASPELRTHMAERARRRALTFAPERMARAYLDAYEAAAGMESLACAS